MALGVGKRTTRVSSPEWTGEGRQPEPIAESALYGPLARCLASTGYACWQEASFLGSWIDAFGRREADGHTIAVELKVQHWQKALEQAKRILPAAHEVYVGVWAPYVHRCLSAENATQFMRSGVGLLSVNGEVEIKIPANPSSAIYGPHVLLPRRASHHPRP